MQKAFDDEESCLCFASSVNKIFVWVSWDIPDISDVSQHYHSFGFLACYCALSAYQSDNNRLFKRIRERMSVRSLVYTAKASS